jgi:hypothetical protein
MMDASVKAPRAYLIAREEEGGREGGEEGGGARDRREWL